MNSYLCSLFYNFYFKQTLKRRSEWNQIKIEKIIPLLRLGDINAYDSKAAAKLESNYVQSFGKTQHVFTTNKKMCYFGLLLDSTSRAVEAIIGVVAEGDGEITLPVERMLISILRSFKNE